MKRLAAAFGFLVLAAAVLAAAGIGYVRATGLSARPQPGPVETTLARSVRRLAVIREIRERGNPVPATPEALADGLAHFADHCASCHANDGSGSTEMGQGLYPRPPDMRTEVTQDLTDGELFHIIEHGVRFTGMPAWGDGSPEAQESSWRLVHFIRRLPALTSEELERMEELNPRSPEEIRQQIEEERFLAGETDASPPTPHEHTRDKP